MSELWLYRLGDSEEICENSNNNKAAQSRFDGKGLVNIRNRLAVSRGCLLKVLILHNKQSVLVYEHACVLCTEDNNTANSK